MKAKIKIPKLNYLQILLCAIFFSVFLFSGQINANTENLNLVSKRNQVQQKIVQGRVADSNGEPLPGVAVVIKGTTTGTVTNADGEFQFSIPTDAQILVFSFVGMETQELPISESDVYNVTLNESLIELEDVVVVGYGKLKSSQISSSISRVTSSEIADRPVARLDQAIQGKLAGVEVQETSGSPGQTLSIKVRGKGSVNFSTSPLYVVDGFPISGDIDNIDVGDIESIEVLKDAASASIYGSRGANGVILITTKGGSKGKSVIEVDSYFGLQNRFSKVDVLKRDEYIDYAIDERTNSYFHMGGDISVPESKRHNYNYAIDPLWRTDPTSLPDNDWQDLISRTSPIQSYTISASGGTDKVKYYVSNNYFDQQGIILNSDFKRYSTRANVESTFNKYLTLGANLSFANSERNDPWTGSDQGPIALSLHVAPIVGINEQTVEGGSNYYHAHFYLNPIAMAEEILNKTKKYNLTSNVYAELRPVKNLALKSSFGKNIQIYKNQFYRTNNINRGTGSLGSESNTLIHNRLSENTVVYDISENNFILNLLAGFSYQEETYENSSLGKSGFADDDIKTLNAGTQLDSGTSSAEKWSMISYFSRANLSYFDKYMMTASIRRDGSSRFGKDNRWGVFPSISLGWIISEESFMSNLKKQISNLKLRGSFGIVGNNNIGNYSSIGLMSSASYIVQNNKEGGYSPSSFTNTSLGWEKTSTTDIGIDMGFLNNRINLSLDYYISNTRDLLLQVQIPQVTGFSSALQNIGKVQNRGFEVELLTRNLVGKFNWTTSFNISNNINKVKALGPDGSPIHGYSQSHLLTVTRIGDPIGSYYFLETDGLFKDQIDVDTNKAMAYLNPKPQPGDLKYKDQNNDGIIDENDKVICGNNAPDFFWGLTNTFTYKGFDVSIFMDGQWGNKLLNISKWTNAQSRGNVPGFWRDRWRSEDNPGKGKIPRAVVTENMSTPSDWWLENASFWRIRSISLGYDLPQSLCDKIAGINKIKIYSSIDNVYMYDHYHHLSQTASRSNTGTMPGLDADSTYPLSSTYKLGINIKF